MIGGLLFAEIAENFVWFPHMWKHNHAHEFNLTYLEAIMTQNKLFAQVITYAWSLAVVCVSRIEFEFWILKNLIVAL